MKRFLCFYKYSVFSPKLINILNSTAVWKNKSLTYLYILHGSFIYIYIYIYIYIPLHPCDYLYKVWIKINVATDEGKSWNEIWHWRNRWNWNTCTKLVLSLSCSSWTHDLIAQSVRVSEQNSVVVGSFPTQTNFLQLLQTIFHC